MRILVIGSGGREHALTKALRRSPSVTALYAAPGNPGTAQVGTNFDLAATDVDALAHFARQESIDVTVAGPERPLVTGIVDRFEAEGLSIVGPTGGRSGWRGARPLPTSSWPGTTSRRPRSGGLRQTTTTRRRPISIRSGRRSS